MSATSYRRDVDMDGWPSVSAIMPVRNEESTLADAVHSLVDQRYPGDLEVVLAVAPSDDRTATIASELAATHPSITVIDNPEGDIPIGLNRAIAASDGEIVVRVDGHSKLPTGYVKRAVETMIRSGAVNVGGCQIPVGRDRFERTVSKAMTSFFGTGGARFRVGGQEGPVDTVFLGVFDRRAGARVGWYDEGLLRNEDYELNIRLREAGGEVRFDPELAVTYHPRSSLATLAGQYFHYGYWKAVVVRRHPDSLKPRQAGPALLPFISALGVLAATLRNPLRPIARAFGVATVATVVLVPTARVIAVMQASWCAGFWKSVWDQITGKLAPTPAVTQRHRSSRSGEPEPGTGEAEPQD